MNLADKPLLLDMTHRVLLDRVLVCSSKLVPQVDLVHGKIATHLDMVADALVVQLIKYIPAMADERLVVHEKWPLNWWEAFKERWLQWLPWVKIQYRQIDIERTIYKAVCPHLSLEPHTRHVEFLCNHSTPTPFHP